MSNDRSLSLSCPCLRLKDGKTPQDVIYVVPEFPYEYGEFEVAYLYAFAHYYVAIVRSPTYI